MAKGTRGMSLIEAIVGLGLLVGGLLTLSGLIASARGLSAAARDETMAVWLARAKLAQLHALTFSVHRLPSGAIVFATDVVTDVSVEPHRLGGPGLAASPPETLARDQAGYVDFLDASGRWLPPERRAEAVWVRRWAVGRTGAGAAELATFDVLVARLAQARAVSGASLAVQPGVVRLAGARARRAS